MKTYIYNSVIEVIEKFFEGGNAKGMSAVVIENTLDVVIEKISKIEDGE